MDSPSSHGHFFSPNSTVYFDYVTSCLLISGLMKESQCWLILDCGTAIVSYVNCSVSDKEGEGGVIGGGVANETSAILWLIKAVFGKVHD